ncbi:cache domain-containing sensor histidine kinase [Clostridium oryzae]|nr:sensor histidine kinase [Clostridium oryzae]
MKIKKKLVLIYLMAVLLPILLVGTYLTSGIRNMVIDRAISEAKTNSDRIVERLNEIIRIANYVSDRMYFNDKLAGIVNKKYKDYAQVVKTYDDNKDIFDEYLNYYKEIASIRFYVNNNTMLNDSEFIKVDKYIQQAYWYKEAIKNDGRILWLHIYDDISRTKYLSLIRLIKDSNGKILGVLVINISGDSIRDIIKDEPYDTFICINGQTVNSKNNESLSFHVMKKSFFLRDNKSRKTKVKYRGREYDILTSTFYDAKASKSKFQVHMIVPIVNITNEANSITIKSGTIMLVSVVTSILLTLLLLKSFSRRVVLLREEMHKVVQGDFNITERIDGKDEIGELYEDLCTMINSIKQLINEVYVSKIQQQQLNNKQKEVQFEMLASQINPHFLYNTLETIRMKAYCNGQKEIADIVKMLGKIMRRNLEATSRLVTLNSELDLVKSYLEIQKLRFGDRIDYSIDILCDIDHYEILPLLLQPVVENAFVHGLESKEGSGIIKIVIREEERMVISISDNGLGIDRDRLEHIHKLLEDYDNSDHKSIGLSNVNQRIKLYYGKKYGVEIKSEINNGTAVDIFLPIGEEKKNAKSLDS